MPLVPFLSGKCLQPLVYFGVRSPESSLTEQTNPSSEKIDRISTTELLKIINQEDQGIAAAVEKEIPNIARTIDAIVERFGRGGRLFYAGAGTSGRLGVLDAAECPPTFGVASDRVRAVLAGGPDALWASQEKAEDDASAGQRDLISEGFSAGDSLVAISASGHTPYALGAAQFAKSLKAFNVSISCNPHSKLATLTDISITPIVGAEIIAGSTRMKAGTAQKIVLNMISSGVMVKMGYVLGNLMVDVQLNSEKLRQRAERIIVQISGVTTEQARTALDAASGQVRLAIVMAKHDLDVKQAKKLLTKEKNNIREALENIDLINSG